MFDFTIRVAGSQTDVAVRDGVVDEFSALLVAGGQAGRPASALVLTDTNVGPLYADRVVRSLSDGGWRVSQHCVRAGEGSKSFDGLTEVCAALADAGIGRDGLLVAVGGGVVSDLGGLAAAVWMRGVTWAICPTTVESAIDASIGGKTAINADSGKNLVGAFHQPIVVAVDPVCLETLDARDVRAGLAESVKHALIVPGDFFAWHEANAEAISTIDSAVRTELLRRNIGVKADVVSSDPHERTGLRQTLNLGHTIGHAIETCCDYKLRHGECVSLGLVACCRISCELGLLSASDLDRVERCLGAIGLPVVLEEAPVWTAVWAAMQHDKKSRAGVLQFVLLEKIGLTLTGCDVPEPIIRDAYQSLLP